MERQINITESESLKLITSMINKAQNRFNENGTLYLLWGWLILGCCLFQFANNNFFHWEYGFAIWYTTWIAVAYQLYYLKKKRRKEGVSTYTGSIINYVWISIFICAFILMMVLLKNEYFFAIFPVILVLYGLPTFLSGIIIRFKPLQAGGIACWVLAIICVFLPLKYQILLIGLSVIVAWIIPGYLLKSKFKLENNG